MTWKERVLNHPIWFAGTILISGFAAGIATNAYLSKIGVPTTQSATDWSDEAREAGWISKVDCPAYPVSASITAPGDGAEVGVRTFAADNSDLNTDVVVQTSRPIPEANSVGLIVNEVGTTNFHVVFPVWSAAADRQVFRDSDLVLLPFKMGDATKELKLWAVVVDDERKVGTIFHSIEQVKASDPDMVISPGISLQVRRE